MMDGMIGATEPIFEIEVETSEEQAIEDDVKNDDRKKDQSNDAVLEVFTNQSNVNESLAVLSNTSLYGDIYEMEKSDMEISDSEKTRENVKTANERETKSNTPAKESALQLEEGELAPEPDDPVRALPTVKEYYNRLGKIFEEARRMSQEIRKGFSQLFTEEHLNALENQLGELSTQQAKGMQLRDTTNMRDLKLLPRAVSSRIDAKDRRHHSREHRSSTRHRHRHNRKRSPQVHGKLRSDTMQTTDHRSLTPKEKKTDRRSSSPKKWKHDRHSLSPSERTDRRRSSSPKQWKHDRHGLSPKQRKRDRSSSPKQWKHDRHSLSPSERTDRRRSSSPKQWKRDGPGISPKQRTRDRSSSSPKQWKHDRHSVSPKRKVDRRSLSPKQRKVDRRSKSPKQRKENEKKSYSFLEDSSRDHQETKPYPHIDKKEKKRAQTLVCRQMRFISQHMDNADAKPIPPGVVKTFTRDEIPIRDDEFKPAVVYREKITKPSDIKTLQDFEIFLDDLKTQNRDKVLNDKDYSYKLSKLKHKDNIHEDWLVLLDKYSKEREEDIEKETQRRLKDIEKREAERKGLHFKSSRTKFKDTFTEPRKNTYAASNIKMKPVVLEKKKIIRKPVKFAMKKGMATNSRDRAKQLFSASSRSSSSSSMSSLRHRDLTPASPKPNSKYDSQSFEKVETQGKVSVNIKTQISDIEVKKETNEFMKKQKEKNTREKIPVKHSDENIPPKDLMLDHTAVINKTPKINYYEDEFHSELSSANKQEKLPKTKTLKKLVVLGRKGDLQKIMITPKLRKLMLNNPTGKGILLRVVKRNGKLITQIIRQPDVLKRAAEKAKPADNTKKPDMTLKQLEDFMNDLREKRTYKKEDDPATQLEPDCIARESRFLDRHRAKRKAKLMACLAITDTVVDKEARLLESMKQAKRQEEREMAEALKIFKAENDAVMQGFNPVVSREEKLYKNMIQESQTVNNEPQETNVLVFEDNPTDTCQQNVENPKPDFTSSKVQNFLNRMKKDSGQKKRTQPIKLPITDMIHNNNQTLEI